MARPKTAVKDKVEKNDFDLFQALSAIDRKDYTWFSTLSEEQQKKFVPYMMTYWTSTIKGNAKAQEYFLLSTEYHANKYLFNENVTKHPQLVWMMLCAASPGIGTQFHQWIPNISLNVSKLKSPAKQKDINDYYAKIYPKLSKDALKEKAEEFVINHKRKMKLASFFPNMKIADIEMLNKIITDEDIKNYEKENGNG